MKKILPLLLILVVFESNCQVISKINKIDSISIKGRLEHTYNDENNSYYISKKSGIGYYLQVFNKFNNQQINELVFSVANNTYEMGWPKFSKNNNQITILGLKKHRRENKFELTRRTIRLDSLKRSKSQVICTFLEKEKDYNPIFSLSENGEYVVVYDKKGKYFEFYQKDSLLTKLDLNFLFPKLTRGCQYFDDPSMIISNSGRVFISPKRLCNSPNREFSGLISLSFDNFDQIKRHNFNLKENIQLGRAIKFEVNESEGTVLAYSNLTKSKFKNKAISHVTSTPKSILNVGFLFTVLDHESGETLQENTYNLFTNGKPIPELKKLTNKSILNGCISINKISKINGGYIFQVSSFYNINGYSMCNRYNATKFQEHLFKAENGSLVGSAHIKSSENPITVNMTENKDDFYLYSKLRGSDLGKEYNMTNKLNRGDWVILLKEFSLHKIGIDLSSVPSKPKGILSENDANKINEISTFEEAIEDCIFTLYVSKKHMLYFYELSLKK